MVYLFIVFRECSIPLCLFSLCRFFPRKGRRNPESVPISHPSEQRVFTGSAPDPGKADHMKITLSLDLPVSSQHLIAAGLSPSSPFRFISVVASIPLEIEQLQTSLLSPVPDILPRLKVFHNGLIVILLGAVLFIFQVQHLSQTLLQCKIQFFLTEVLFLDLQSFHFRAMNITAWPEPHCRLIHTIDCSIAVIPDRFSVPWKVHASTLFSFLHPLFLLIR